MDEGKMFTIALSAVILASIIGLSIYHISDRALMANNIESAINKGINPMSVRCSYVRGDDPICIAFAAKSEEVSTAPVAPTKK